MKLYLGKHLKQLRYAKNLTQEQLAEKLGVSFRSVSRWEKGGSYPDVEMIPDIAAFFQVSTDFLMGVDEASKEKNLRWEKERAFQIKDRAKQLSFLRELHRRYPRNPEVLYWLILAITRGFPDLFQEQLSLSDKILALPDTPPHFKNTVIQELITAASEETLPMLLDKYATESDLSRTALLERRYQKKNKTLAAHYHLLSLLQHLSTIFQKMTFNITDTSALEDGLQRKFALLNTLTDCTEQSLVAGDGVPDLWFNTRWVEGVRLAAICIGNGKREEGFAHLEDAVSLLESFYSLPDNSFLTYRCPSLNLLGTTLQTGAQNQIWKRQILPPRIYTSASNPRKTTLGFPCLILKRTVWDAICSSRSGTADYSPTSVGLIP